MLDFHLTLEERIPALMRYATALTRDVDDAEELVADTIRDALDHPRQHRGDARLSLLTTLHDLRGNPFRAMTLGCPVVRQPEALLTLSDLDDALGRLTEEHRAVILLIGLEGLSLAEVSTVLRLALSTLRSRLSRARAELRRLMGVQDVPQKARPAARKAA